MGHGTLGGKSLMVGAVFGVPEVSIPEGMGMPVIVKGEKICRGSKF